jgi:hypothetical protein
MGQGSRDDRRGGEARPAAGALGPYPPRAAARRPSSAGSSDAQSVASCSSEQLAARERRAARRVHREAMALRVSRSVIAPEHRRMFVLRQSLKRWHGGAVARARMALRSLTAQHATALVRLQAIVRGRQQRRRCAAVPCWPCLFLSRASVCVRLHGIKGVRF